MILSLESFIVLTSGIVFRPVKIKIDFHSAMNRIFPGAFWFFIFPGAVWLFSCETYYTAQRYCMDCQSSLNTIFLDSIGSPVMRAIRILKSTAITPGIESFLP
jgi:hypothetical protein